VDQHGGFGDLLVFRQASPYSRGNGDGRGGASVEFGGNSMLAVFKRGARQREFLDLTAPADEGDGIVGRWVRDSTARDESDAPDADPPPAEPAD
jgi:hypothetical protein